MKSIDDLAVAGRRVLVRTDMNVPLDGDRITDDGRIRASLPTLTALMNRGARVIVCAHLGRPEGKPDLRYSLAPVACRLGELLGREVALATDVVGPSAHATVAGVHPGDLAMLENLRFNDAETSTDDMYRGYFADRLVAMTDLLPYPAGRAAARVTGCSARFGRRGGRDGRHKLRDRRGLRRVTRQP